MVKKRGADLFKIAFMNAANKQHSCMGYRIQYKTINTHSTF